MKNNECQINIYFKGGWTQTYRKVNGKGWIQTTNGIERVLTAEQVLSHILPVLAIDYNGYKKIEVVPDRVNDGS
jgi:hypothetical protein